MSRLRNRRQFAASTAIRIVIAACGLVTGCRSSSPGDGGWLIESYEKGVISVRHAGATYKASCTASRSFNNAPSLTDPKNVVSFEACDLAITLIGRSVQGFGGDQRDADGQITVMWDSGSTLAIRRWRDQHTPWRMDEFTITVVTRNK